MRFLGKIGGVIVLLCRYGADEGGFAGKATMEAMRSGGDIIESSRCGQVSSPPIIVPDPFGSILNVIRFRDTANLSCGLNQRRRRARILADARRLLAQRGFEGVLIQDLAKMTDLSKQTIYNLVGDKRKVIADSINDHVVEMARIADGDASGSGEIISLVNLYCLNFTHNPEYTRNASLSLFRHDRGVCREVRAKQAQLFRAWLYRQRARGLLRERVDVDVLAGQLASLNESDMIDWANGACSAHELCKNMIFGHGFMLLGAMCQAEAGKIEAWMYATH